MLDKELLIICVIVGAVLFDFVNGWNDSANAIATVVSTRVLSPWQAIFLAASLNFLGAFISTKVAHTVGKNIIDADMINLYVVLASVLAASTWVVLMTGIGMPISSSHSLFGALVGSAYAFKGLACLKLNGILVIFLSLLIAPVIGFIGGMVLMIIIARVFKNWPLSKVNKYFGKFQLFSASFVAFSHGSNDAQKAMGVIVLALMSGGYVSEFDVPIWVIVMCGSSISLGTALGGWKVIKTLGTGLLKLKPYHGFAAETSASLTLITASTLGFPVSTTHTTTSAIMGVGAAMRFSSVRWELGKKILYAWLVTLPATILLGILYYEILTYFFA